MKQLLFIFFIYIIISTLSLLLLLKKSYQSNYTNFYNNEKNDCVLLYYHWLNFINSVDKTCSKCWLNNFKSNLMDLSEWSVKYTF